MCWRIFLGLLGSKNKNQGVTKCINHRNISAIHVQNVQVCYIGIHMPWWFAAPINPSSIIHSDFFSV
uniref:Uncharacterized protein n=1 Tax=Macaca fascicularis TaxID=9541 RepID=A0A7N9IH59_MACFA